jgi:hypothetical protein
VEKKFCEDGVWAKEVWEEVEGAGWEEKDCEEKGVWACCEKGVAVWEG